MYIPTCCEAHRKSVIKSSKNIDTSRWKFSKPDIMKHPQCQANYQTPLSMEEKPETTAYALAQIESSQPSDGLDVNCESQQYKPGNIQNEPTDREKGPTEKTIEGQNNVRKPKIHERNEEQNMLSSLNMYRNLLDNVDKAERDKKKSDPEAIACKIVNDSLDESAKEFCQWTSCLVLPENVKRDTTSMADINRNEDLVIQTDKLRKLFHIDLCQSTICPYIPYIIRDTKEMPNQIYERQRSMQEERSKEEKIEPKNTYKQAYYIPPKEWFAVKDKAVKAEFPFEDEELIRSFGLRKFMDFLSERGEKPPKMLKDMKKAHEDWLKKIKEDKKHAQR